MSKPKGKPIFQPSDYIKVEIGFEYEFRRPYYPDSDRWGPRLHIVCKDPDHEFKGAQPAFNCPICSCDNPDMRHYTMKEWKYEHSVRPVKVCQNCVMKLLQENSLHVQHEYIK